MWFKRNKFLLAALMIGGLVRAVVLFLFFSDFQEDPDAYKQIAVNVRTLGIYGQAFGKQKESSESESEKSEVSVQPTAFRPPLYPLILSAMVVSGDDGQAYVSPSAMAALHWLFGLATLWLAFEVGRNFMLSEPGCFVLTLLVACDPIALRQSCLPMTETPAILIATLGIWILTSRHSITRRTSSWSYLLGIGLMIGCFSLCRPTFLIWGGLIFWAMLAGWMTIPQQFFKQRIISAFTLLVGIGLALAPWTIRNYVNFGKPIFATSHGGYTIFLGNNNSFYDYLSSGKSSTWDGETELREIVLEIRNQSLVEFKDGSTKISEVTKDRLYYQKAKQVIQLRPFDFLYACWVRVVRFWSILPRTQADQENQQTVGMQQKIVRYGSAVWYAALFLLALMGLYRLFVLFNNRPEIRRSLWIQFLPAILLVVAFQGLHLLYWSNMRMRAPLVVVIALLAVIGLSSAGWGRRMVDQAHGDTTAS